MILSYEYLMKNYVILTCAFVKKTFDTAEVSFWFFFGILLKNFRDYEIRSQDRCP